jgi:sugar (pentulose or hexulose) kinase
MMMGSDEKIIHDKKPALPSLLERGMKGEAVIVIFDVGKTNKKISLFNEQYKLVFEESKKFAEIADEDGFPCEDVFALTEWIKESFDTLTKDERFEIKAVNFSGYGASFVYVDKVGKVIAPLYNYLKPYPAELQKKFYNDYGGKSVVAKQTASPALGNLNSGMQLYRLKYEQPEVFATIKYALHLPQYLSYILTGKGYSDITSIGSHTNLWNFQNNKYHDWVKAEKILEKFPPILSCTEIAGYINNSIPVGAGLHDSSAALIPYFSSFNEPFILLSTGTWCISLNPFNHSILTDYELNEDCLCYLSYEGKSVKASRLFAGYEHEQQVKKLSAHFKKPENYYSTVKCDNEILSRLKYNKLVKNEKADNGKSNFQYRSLDDFSSYEEAYHRLMSDIIMQQVKSTNLVLTRTEVKRIFVDGGFSKNPIYMYLLAEAFPQIEVYAASVAQASALGTALAIHRHWNTKQLPSDIIDLKLYAVVHNTTSPGKKVK